MRRFGMNLIASAKPLGPQRTRLHKRPNRSYRDLSSADKAAHSALAKRPKKNSPRPPRRSARRSHRLSNCAEAKLSGIRAAGLGALTRFFAVGTGLARAGSAATLLSVVAIAVCVAIGSSAGTRYCSNTQPRCPDAGSVIWTQPFCRLTTCNAVPG